MWRNDDAGKICKVVEEGTTEDLTSYICSIIPKFMEHCFVKRMQATSYNEERDVAEHAEDDTQAFLQVDFSENYTCVFQDEIQSAHWKQAQVNLFTAALWCTDSLRPIVLASDNLNHSKETIIAYVDRLLSELPSSVKQVSVWSDGPASQFKNRFILAALKPLEEKHDLRITWNFFATSHGKGPVDGIGGAVKRVVWNAVKNRKHIVVNATNFAEAASTSNVKVVEVKSTEIVALNDSLSLCQVFSDATPIPGIAAMHYMRLEKGKAECHALTRDAALIDDHCNDANVRMQISVGDWCSVEYDGVAYPGEVKVVEGSELKVSVMIQAGNHWKWPTSPDDVFYPSEKIMKRLDPPVVANHRGHFSFNNF